MINLCSVVKGPKTASIAIVLPMPDGPLNSTPLILTFDVSLLSNFNEMTSLKSSFCEWNPPKPTSSMVLRVSSFINLSISPIPSSSIVSSSSLSPESLTTMTIYVSLPTTLDTPSDVSSLFNSTFSTLNCSFSPKTYTFKVSPFSMLDSWHRVARI